MLLFKKSLFLVFRFDPTFLDYFDKNFLYRIFGIWKDICDS